MSRMPAKILNALKEARTAAMLKNASFGTIGNDQTDFVKDLVRLHHSTWIISPLDRVIEWAEDKR